MHEAEAAAPGAIETNYGTLGWLGTAYYGDWTVNHSGYFIHQEPGALAGTAFNNFPPGLSGTNVAHFGGMSSFADAGAAPAYNPTGGMPFTRVS